MADVFVAIGCNHSCSRGSELVFIPFHKVVSKIRVAQLVVCEPDNLDYDNDHLYRIDSHYPLIWTLPASWGRLKTKGNDHLRKVPAKNK